MDDGFADHPKLLKAGPLAKALFIDGLCYAARHLTDGHLPQAQVRAIIATGYRRQTVTLLVEAGLWAPTEGGYQIHDYLEYQPSARSVRRQRESNTERQQAWRMRRADPDKLSDNAPVTPLVTPAPGNASLTPAPYPSRTHPVPEETSETTVSEAKKRRAPVVSDAFRARMHSRFGTVLNSLDERIDDALNHKAVRKVLDVERYVQGWLRRDAERNGSSADPDRYAEFARDIEARRAAHAKTD